MKISFSPPYIDDSVIAEVEDTLRSGWITTGPKVKSLEQEIKNFTGTSKVLCVNSWTSGAIMILRWLGLKPIDEVIVPAYTYCATALAVLHAGAKVVLVDVGEDFNISIDAVRKAITPKTKAIIPVDIAGFPCNYDELMDLVNEPEFKKMYHPSSKVQEMFGRIMVLNDAAHSFGSQYDSKRKTGTETDIAIFSLHAVKNVTTAEGGAICLNLPKPFDNESVYAGLRIMSLNCQTKDAFTKSKAGGWKYDIIGLGMKINMADINAAIGLAQIRQYKQLLSRRKEIFNRYNTLLSKYSWAKLPPAIEGEKETSYHVYALRINGFDEKARDMLIDEMTKSEVAVNVHFMPLPMLMLFKNMGFDIVDYPKAYENYCCEISLPIYPQLTNEQVDFVAETLIRSYNNVVSKRDLC